MWSLSTLKRQRTGTSRFQVKKTERRMRVPSKHSEKDLQTTRITDAENTHDSKYWYADHIKQEKTGKETIQKDVWDLLALYTFTHGWKQLQTRRIQWTGRRYIIHQQKHISYLMSICWFKHTTSQRSTQATTPEWWPLDYLGSQEPNSSKENGTGHLHGNLRTLGQCRLDSEWLVTIQQNLEIELFHRWLKW